MLFMTTMKMQYIFQGKLETKFWQLLPARQFGKNSTFPMKSWAKEWQLLLTRPQVLMIGLVHILPDKEEKDRIEYTCMAPKWALE